MIINSGISFGLEIPGVFFWQFLFLGLVLYSWSRDFKIWGWFLVFLGGALNIIERWRFGGVRDYWRIPGTSIYNNLNDYLIAAGVIQILLYFIWKKRQK